MGSHEGKRGLGLGQGGGVVSTICVGHGNHDVKKSPGTAQVPCLL